MIKSQIEKLRCQPELWKDSRTHANTYIPARGWGCTVLTLAQDMGLIFPPGFVGRYMGFIWSGLDESSDPKQRIVFVVAGYLARQGDWTDIEGHWLRRLERENDPRPMRYFSSHECQQLSGEFRRFRDPIKYPKPKGREAADAIREDLMLLLRSSRACGFALGVNMKDYRAARKSARARKVIRSNPYEQTYITMMVHIAGTCKDEMKTMETVAFLCDEHNRAVNVKDVYDKVKEQNPRCGPWMGSLTYMDNKRSPAIQAGDLLASRSKEFLREYIRTPDDLELRAELVKKWKPTLGGNVGVKCLDMKSIMLMVNANLPKGGRLSIYSTQLGTLFRDLI